MFRTIGLITTIAAVAWAAFTFAPPSLRAEIRHAINSGVSTEQSQPVATAENRIVRAIREREMYRLQQLEATQRQYDARLECRAERERAAGNLAANQLGYEIPADNCG